MDLSIIDKWKVDVGLRLIGAEAWEMQAFIRFVIPIRIVAHHTFL